MSFGISFCLSLVSGHASRRQRSRLRDAAQGLLWSWCSLFSQHTLGGSNAQGSHSLCNHHSLALGSARERRSRRWRWRRSWWRRRRAQWRRLEWWPLDVRRRPHDQRPRRNEQRSSHKRPHRNGRSRARGCIVRRHGRLEGCRQLEGWKLERQLAPWSFSPPPQQCVLCRRRWRALVGRLLRQLLLRRWLLAMGRNAARTAPGLGLRRLLLERVEVVHDQGPPQDHLADDMRRLDALCEDCGTTNAKAGIAQRSRPSR